MSNDNTSTQDKQVTLEDLRALRASLSNPVFRIPLDMNINKFKRMIKNSDLVLSKAERNRLVRAYKQKAWGEYNDIVKGMSSFPSHVVESTANGETSREQGEQASDLPVAGEQGVLRRSEKQITPAEPADKKI